jgi:hypothetical protein
VFHIVELSREKKDFITCQFRMIHCFLRITREQYNLKKKIEVQHCIKLQYVSQTETVEINSLQKILLSMMAK